MKLIGKLLVALGLAVGVVGAQAANIVTNGSFETGNFSGWTQTGNSGFSGVTCPGGAPDGSCFAFFGPVTLDGGISQVLTGMLPGRFYTVSFSLSPDGGTPSDFSATLGGATLVSQTNPAASPFHTLSFLALATSASETLAFNFRDDPGFISLDAVSVSVPEPASLALLGIALGGMGFARRRKAKA